MCVCVCRRFGVCASLFGRRPDREIVFVSFVRAGEAKLRGRVCFIAGHPNRKISFSSPPLLLLLAEWSVLFAMGFYILDVLTHGSHMGFMSLSMFLQSFMHGFNGSLSIFECLVYGFYRFLSDLL